MKKRVRTPETDRLIAHLRDLLRIADRSFTDEQRPQFADELLEIPEIVQKLQGAIGKVRAVRVPFWKCVSALDHDRPGLALVSTLDALVERACSLPPGPLVQLLTLKAKNKLTAEERAVVDEIEKRSDYQLDELPADPARWGPVVERVASGTFKQWAAKLRRRWPDPIRPLELTQFLAFAACLNFIWEHKKWLDHFLPSLEPFVLFLDELQNEDYDCRRNSILFGYVRSAVAMKKRHTRQLANRRQDKYVKSLPSKRPTPKRTVKLAKQAKAQRKLPPKASQTWANKP